MLRLVRTTNMLKLELSALSLEGLQKEEKEVEFYNVFSLPLDPEFQVSCCQLLERKLEEGKHLVTL